MTAIAPKTPLAAELGSCAEHVEQDVRTLLEEIDRISEGDPR